MHINLALDAETTESHGLNDSTVTELSVFNSKQVKTLLKLKFVINALSLI